LTEREHAGEPIFVGRDEELGQLLENVRSGTHTLIVGDKGIGKTALLQQALKFLSGKLPRIDLSAHVMGHLAGRLVGSHEQAPLVLVVTNPSPLSECLRELARKLWESGLLLLDEDLRRESDWEVIRKRFTALGRPAQQEAVRESLRLAPDHTLLVFDSLDRLTPAHQPFLESLFPVTTILASACKLNDAIHYKSIWSTFSRIDLGPLPGAAAHELVERLIQAHRLRPPDRRLFIGEVLSSSSGNPFHIRLGVWRMSRRPGLDDTEVRSLRRIQQGEYFNMGPIYIFGASIFTLYKILTIGMDNREFYIYFSALGFLVYLTFRVFRNFFLFRPQRKR
jgi:hypothetical protein